MMKFRSFIALAIAGLLLTGCGDSAASVDTADRESITIGGVSSTLTSAELDRSDDWNSVEYQDPPYGQITRYTKSFDDQDLIYTSIFKTSLGTVSFFWRYEHDRDTDVDALVDDLQSRFEGVGTPEISGSGQRRTLMYGCRNCEDSAPNCLGTIYDMCLDISRSVAGKVMVEGYWSDRDAYDRAGNQ